MDNPTNRYETVLTRRSIRKHTNGVNKNEAGDVSLGLLLKILSGKVIVQRVKPELIDGSASPVASSKAIRRGDVLLSLNGQCLVFDTANLEAIHELLTPLYTPNQEGIYPKTVHLELARGEGLALLEKAERMETQSSLVPEQPRRASLRRLFPNRSAPPEEEGYGALETNISMEAPQNNKKAVGGAAAMAGIAGLVFMGPFTAVAAAGGAAYVVAKKKKKGQNEG